MLVTMHCENCWTESLSPDEVRFTLKMTSTYSKCDHCHQHQDTDHLIMFCSLKCILEYFEKHKDKFEILVDRFKIGNMWEDMSWETPRPTQ